MGEKERMGFCGTNIKSCRETAIFPSVYLIEFAVAVNGREGNEESAITRSGEKAKGERE